MDEATDPLTQLAHAQRAQRRLRHRGAWYPPMMLGFGVATIAIVTALPMVRGTWDGLIFTAVVVAWAAMLFWWKSRFDVRPVSRVDKWRWVVAWALLYAVGVCWIGPVFLGDRVVLWVIMGVVVAIPAVAEAVRVWRRDRR